MGRRIELGGLISPSGHLLQLGDPGEHWAQVPMGTQVGDTIVVDRAEFYPAEVVNRILPARDGFHGTTECFARLIAIPAEPLVQSWHERILRSEEPW